MFFDSFNIWWWPFLFIFLAGVLPTAIWRWAGALLVGNIDDNSQWLVLIRCLATALVAAVIAQLIFHPTGALADISLAVRLLASVMGFAAFLVLGKRLLIAVLAAETVLLIGALLST